MLGASARYSRSRVPVETGTPPHYCKGHLRPLLLLSPGRPAGGRPRQEGWKIQQLLWLHLQLHLRRRRIGHAKGIYGDGLDALVGTGPIHAVTGLVDDGIGNL